MKRAYVCLLLGGLIVSTAASAEAQRREGERPTREQVRERFTRARPAPAIGVRGIYDFDIREFGVGAHAQIPLGLVLRLVPSGEIYFGDEATWQANADIALSLLLLRAGGGVALVDGARVGDDGTEVGFNLFVGLQSPAARTRVRPFVDARWTFLDDTTPFRLIAGVNFPLGGAAR